MLEYEGGEKEVGNTLLDHLCALGKDSIKVFIHHISGMGEPLLQGTSLNRTKANLCLYHDTTNAII